MEQMVVQAEAHQVILTVAQVETEQELLDKAMLGVLL
jgi:hypothetical protein